MINLSNNLQHQEVSKIIKFLTNFSSCTQIPELAWHAFLLHRAVESKAMTAWAVICIKLACTVMYKVAKYA